MRETETLPGLSADCAPGLENAFSFVPEERAYTLSRIEGEIPSFVRGSYYLNGPARFLRGLQRYRHWLDGDGMVCALHFEEGKVSIAHRFVRSTKHKDEDAAGRFFYRTFGTRFPGDRLLRGVALASPVNVSVYPFAGTLLAFGEQGIPWELDPVTLETRGEYTFGGKLNALAPFSAHPKIDPATGEMINFGVSFAAAQPVLNLFRIAASGDLLSRRRLALDRPCSLHDFALSRRYAVFYLAPYLLDMSRFANDGATLMESLSWQPELGSKLLVVSRETGEEVATIPVGSKYCLHTINAFDEGSSLTVDVVELDRPVYDQYEELPDLFLDVPHGRPARLTVNLERRELAGCEEIPYTTAPDFPSIDLRLSENPYRDLWLLGISATGRPGRKFFDQLVHCDWQTRSVAGLWQAPPGSYLGGEPVFIHDPTSTGGAVICQLFDTTKKASSFLLFAAHDIAAGPRAVLHLDTPIHLGFHTAFHA